MRRIEIILFKKYPGSRFLLCSLLLLGCTYQSADPYNKESFISFRENGLVDYPIQKEYDSAPGEIQHLNKLLQTLLAVRSTDSSRAIVDSIIQKIGKSKDTNIKILSESYYLIGVYYLIVKNYYESIKYLNLSVSIKESIGEYDERYAKALYNIGVAFNGQGDVIKYEEYCLKSLELEKKIFGDSSPDLVSTYSSLIIANIELQEYEKAISYSNIASTIADNNAERVSPVFMADLYNNMGGYYSRLTDFSKAKIYLEKSESIYRNSHLDLNDNYINLMNTMAITFGALGLTEKSDEYYEKGIALAEKRNSSFAYNIVFSYAINLAKTGKLQKGESLLISALGRAKARFGENSRSYIEVLNNFADFLREYKINLKKSLEYYEICMNYLSKNDRDLLLRDLVHIGYSLSLYEAGNLPKALEILQLMLFSENAKNQVYGPFDNPGIESIKADKKTLKVLKAKYEILCEIRRKSPDQKILEVVSNTSELIVSLLERVRINISEEESRLILGDRYRDSYLNAISDFNILYNKTGDRRFLDKAFEYSEKSKVAGLLTSTRELKAVQFHLPPEIADFEKKLQRDLSLFDAWIAQETSKEQPDSVKLGTWKENLFETTRIRDSLILVFEKQYPDYYAIKYNTKVVRFKDLPEITGHNGNYISYVASDTTLYIFVANRKHQELLTIQVDSTFYNKIRQFRKLLSLPSASENARTAFENYQSIGAELNKTLIVPIRKYLISNKILISPDNILSYLPFETLPTSYTPGDRILYRDVAYLMNDYDISYIYSATFMVESERNNRIGNKVIAFAPNYPEPIDMQAVLMNRQSEAGKLPDLPFARQEAEYVSKITGGKLFENDKAKESVFKTESGKYDIIHLAMHTVLNDKEPMYSTMIFSSENDTVDDSYLKTYEVYGIPLKAKMVVLSSCNSGSGLLYSGEGILSLARGFMYSGSQSVVMSLWEIEDRSGTEIVKMFYQNLLKGNSKSKALRKARIAYLKQADQLRSHPYFWSTLVIYGNNSPLYYSKHLIIASVLVTFVFVFPLIFYFRKRRYS